MSGSEGTGSVERVRAALLAAGHPDTITAFPAGTRTAADAAAAVGCTVAQIAKSIVFRAGERAALIVTSGANRVDQAKAGALLGVTLARADADWVRARHRIRHRRRGADRAPDAAVAVAGRGFAGARSDLGGRGVAHARLPHHRRRAAPDDRRRLGGGQGWLGRCFAQEPSPNPLPQAGEG
jgi:hypothetical protein